MNVESVFRSQRAVHIIVGESERVFSRSYSFTHQIAPLFFLVVVQRYRCVMYILQLFVGSSITSRLSSTDPYLLLLCNMARSAAPGRSKVAVVVVVTVSLSCLVAFDVRLRFDLFGMCFLS